VTREIGELAFAPYAKMPSPEAILMNTDQASTKGSKPATKARVPGAQPLRGRLPWPVAALLIVALCLAAWLVVFKVTAWLIG
jgi:hypothetical protein